MIQVYNANNTNYEKNGDMTIFPTSTVVHPVLNGSWSAELEHPIDGEGRWKYLQEETVVKMPSFNGDQLFRIRHKEKADSGVICEMEPIFFDSIGDCFLEDVRPARKNGQEALDLMTAPNAKYSGQSNITKAATAYYQYKNLMQAINGDDENSFIRRWGGEILFDNFKVIINDRVGGDYGVELRYGKNIARDGLTEEIDTRSIVTRIYPKAYNGYTMTDNGYVDSPLVNSYPTVKSATITFSDVKMAADEQEDDAEKGVIICNTQAELDTALRKRCQEQYEAGLDKPAVTITADMVLLKDTDLYRDYQVLETVSLGDTVHCRHSRLGIVTDARVVELKYDSMLRKVSSVVLGDFQYNYFNNVSSAVNRIDKAIRPDGTVMAERIAGFINGAMTSLRAQYNVARKQDVLAILFENLDKDNPLYGALAIGTQGIMISKQRTADGRDWEWTTALTAGGLVANIIVAGILSDKLGKNYWNLDTGDFSLSAGTVIGGKTVGQIAKEEIDGFTDGVLSPLLSGLQSKIDEKIETWYQPTDPSANWTGTETIPWTDHNGDPIQGQDGTPVMVLFEKEKNIHEGDLWQNTTDGTEWIYLDGKWARKEIPDEVFDKIDGKAQIFTTQPVPPYNVGDLWFDSATSDIMTCMAARGSGNYAASDWEKRNRYTDDGALDEFIGGIFNPTIVGMQKRLDGQLETWFFDYEPALSNHPASGWTTEEARATHEGDLFFWKQKGYSYRFSRNGEAWEWTRIQDADVTRALAAASKAQDTADGKRRVFVVQPEPPYDIGDLWAGDEGSDLMRCQVSRESGGYIPSDWVKATKYTDDSYAKKVEGSLAAVKKDLKGQIDGKIETYNQTADPSAAWTTEILRAQHTGDLWYHPDQKATKRWDGTGWGGIGNGQAEAAEALAKEKRRVFSTQPSPPYDTGDLWVQGASGDILRCRAARASGSYSAADWERASKYTDDSTLTAFIQGEFADAMAGVRDSMDRKAETWYQDTDPQGAWTEFGDIPLPDHNGNPILDSTGDRITTKWEKGKYAHEGDLWKRTTDNTEWIYKGGKWMPMEVPDEVFDKIDGKAQIFLGTPYPPYAEGDLWATSTEDGKAALKICRTTRTAGSYVATDWIDPRYVDESKVTDKINDYDAALDQLEVFKKLTGGNGEQGIFVKDGRVFINATYILAGMLAGKYVDAKGITVKDKNNTITLSIDEDGNVTIRPSSLYLSGKTVDEIAGEKASAAEKNAKAYTLEQIGALPEASGNLIKGYRFSDRDITDYWDTAGTVRTGIADPEGGNEAAAILPSASDCYISARRATNQAIYSPGHYTVSVWLKASTARTVKISFNRVTYDCALTTEWKKYTFSTNITAIAPSYQLFTIGGWGSIPQNSAWVYAYHPEVISGYTSEDIFNMLTDNGAAQGIYMVNGKVYLNGQYLKALSVTAAAIATKTITADKISVEDLYALGATIGGFKITSVSIYSNQADGNLNGIVLYAGDNSTTGYIRTRKRDTAGSSWTNCFTISGDKITSAAGSNSLSLVRDADTSGDVFSDGTHHTMGSTVFTGTTEVNSNFYVNGTKYTKSATMETKDYGEQAYYCYEMPTPMFGDIGSAVLDDTGACYVPLDDIFVESTSTEKQYQVFLQKCCAGDCWVEEKQAGYFIVRGTPGLIFDWEVKAKQYPHDQKRFTDPSADPTVDFMKLDYETEFYNETENTAREMEEAIYAMLDRATESVQKDVTETANAVTEAMYEES